MFSKWILKAMEIKNIIVLLQLKLATVKTGGLFIVSFFLKTL